MQSERNSFGGYVVSKSINISSSYEDSILDQIYIWKANIFGSLFNEVFKIDWWKCIFLNFYMIRERTFKLKYQYFYINQRYYYLFLKNIYLKTSIETNSFSNLSKFLLLQLQKIHFKWPGADTRGGGRRCPPPWSSEGGARGGTIWLNNCQTSLKTRLNTINSP